MNIAKLGLPISALLLGLCLSCTVAVAGDQKAIAEDKKAQLLASQAKNLSPKIVHYGLNAFKYASKKAHVKKDILTIVDFTQHSANKRLYVFDLKNNKLLLNERVAQGKFSGLYYATHFSNKAGSRESSLGVYITGDIYSGHHGKSLRIHGLEKNINDHAYQRSIVIHQARYMTDEFVKNHLYAGRSFGCFAVAPAVLDRFIDLTRNGSVLFAYAPPEDKDTNITEIE